METIGHWIDGRPHPGTGPRTGPVFDPARGVERARVAMAGPAEVGAAVAAAARALPGWRASSLGHRSAILFAIRERLAASRHDLAASITAEHGKVLADALGEVTRGLENVEYACGIPALLQGGFTREVSTGVDVHAVREPLGVVAGVTPFNFPAMVPMWMFAAAIACGNTFVLKPSERDPSPSLRLAALMAEAGLPPGVFNVVQGDREAVDALLAHPDVRAVSFVGSTPAAQSVYAAATAAGKRVQALAGAKNHMVVLPDADLDAAADAAVSAGYGSAGERCMAVSVVVSVGPDAAADALVAAIAARIDRLRVAPGMQDGADMGPLVTREHRDRVAGYIDGARAQGAAVVVDGRGHPAYAAGEGFFLGPTLIDRVDASMDCYRDEIFGPVLSVVRVPSLDAAIALVNANRWGNGAALFTRDGASARRFEVEVEAGMVGINVPIPVPVGSYSFGGWKDSLFGDAHIYGPEGIRFYTRAKVVTSRWPVGGDSAVDLRFPGTR